MKKQQLFNVIKKLKAVWKGKISLVFIISNDSEFQPKCQTSIRYSQLSEIGLDMNPEEMNPSGNKTYSLISFTRPWNLFSFKIKIQHWAPGDATCNARRPIRMHIRPPCRRGRFILGLRRDPGENKPIL